MPAPRRMTRRGFLTAGIAAAVAACSSGDDAEEAVSQAAQPSATPAPTATSTPRATPTPLPTPTPEPTPVPGLEPIDAPPSPLTRGPFTLGVASGDPTPDAVILWTRLTGFAAELTEPIEVVWEVAEDDTFAVLRATGIATATPALAHSVHADATGLEPDRWYAYRFRVGDFTSMAGRTRTLPADGSTPASVRIGFSSCQRWEDGYYAAHRHLAAEELDLFFFLGDYIYEAAAAERGPRRHDTGTAVTLDDYRRRYQQYKEDPDLQAHHAAVPWVATWDDHEVENNYAGLAADAGGDVDAFTQRRAWAYQAWYEHLPVRLEPPEGPDWPIQRSLRWASLAQFYVLDGRQYRSDQVVGTSLDLAGVRTADYGIGVRPDVALEPAQTMLGDAQLEWLGATASTGGRPRWDVLVQQVLMHGLNVVPGSDPPLVIADSWDGYHGHRREVLQAMIDAGATDLVVLTGDFHAASVGDLRLDPFDYSTEPVGTEFMAPPISSAFPRGLGGLAPILLGANPQIRFFDPRQGYCVADITETSWTTTYRMLDDVTDPGTGVETVATFAVDAGRPGAERV